MTASEVLKKYGIEHYFDANKTHYVVITKDVSREEALRAANMYFRVNSRQLSICDAWEKGDDLYFQRKIGGKNVWAVEVIK